MEKKKKLNLIAGIVTALIVIIPGVLLFVWFTSAGDDTKAESVEYVVFEELDRGDSFNIRVETEHTSESDLELIVEDVKSEYEGVDAVWLWIYLEGEDDLLAKAKIPYNEKGKDMINEDGLWIEYEKQ